MSWKDITLEKALRIIKVDEEDELELIMKQLAECLDKSYDDIENMEPNKIFEQYKEWSFINTLPEMKLTKEITIDEVKYGVMDLSKLTLAQMVDIEEFYKEGFIDNLHRIISILYLPIKSKNRLSKKYILEEYEFDEERANNFLKVDMEFVWGNLLFFYHIEKVYINSLQDCLVNQMMDMRKNQLKTLKEQADELLMMSEQNKKKNE